MRKIFDSQVPALESIDFQSPMFGKELANVFAEMKKLGKDEIEESDLAATFTAIVKHYTGLNVVVVLDEMGPSIDVPVIDKNNPLVNAARSGGSTNANAIKLVESTYDLVRGTVDLRSGKVTGVFSEIQATLYMPSSILSGTKFTPEEAAAMALHEIGHVFVHYEYLSRTIMTNQVLAHLSKRLDQSGSLDERELILTSVKKALKLNELDAQELSKTSDKRVVELVILSSVGKAAVSELGSDIYDFTTWEYLADQYAARCGAGRDLITAMDKIYKGEWNISFRNRAEFFAMEALKLSLILTSVLVPGGFVLTAIPLTIGALLMLSDAGDSRHEQPGARFKRIRNQVVENLKVKDLADADRDRLLADLAVIDSIMKEVSDKTQAVQAIWNILTRRKALRQEAMQKELEDISVNELFVKAAQLHQVA